MRTRFLRPAIVPLALSAAFTAGCAIQPLPEDVAPLDTVEIVDHIRCEMYEALRHQVVLMFDYSGGRAKDIARMIEERPSRPLEEFESAIPLLNQEYQQRLKAFGGTTIGYGFRFEITEQDVAKGDISFGLPWNPLSNFSLKAATGLDKKRTNTRRFFKIETFKELTYSKECLVADINAPNIVYPITGEIGLRNSVDDFVKLTTRGARTDTSDAKDVKSFSDKLTFTTEISGSINPRVKLSPLTDRFKVADAGGELSAKRTDIHELTVTFAISKDFAPGAVSAAAPARRAAVIDELRALRVLDAVERSGGIATP